MGQDRGDDVEMSRLALLLSLADDGDDDHLLGSLKYFLSLSLSFPVY